ncbi:MAG: MFS transporter [Myxococcota bacterium]
MSPALRLAAFYAAMFTGVGVMVGFLPLHLTALGLSAPVIGALFAGRTALSSMGPPLWGLWADRLGDARLPLVVASSISALAFLPLLWTENPTVTMALMLLQGFGGGALAPLTDSMTLGVLKHAPEKFGRVRMAGTLAFGVGVLGFSLVVTSTGDPALMSRAGSLSVPAIFSTLVLTLIVSLGLPRVERPRLVRMETATTAIRQAPFLLLLLAGAFHWAAHAPVTVMLGLHLRDLGGGPSVVAAALCAQVVTEVAIMYFAPRLLSVMNAPTALVGIFVAGLVRWTANALLTSPVAFAAMQAAHGVTFGLYYVVSVRAVQQAIPEEARSTGQTVFFAVVFGLGGVFGTLLTGEMYEAGKGPLMFAAAAALDVAALVTMLFYSRVVRRRGAP